MEDLATTNELKKEEFAIKFDNGYLCYENELQVISENNLVDKLLFSFDDQVEECDEEIIAAVKGTNIFEDVKLIMVQR